MQSKQLQMKRSWTTSLNHIFTWKSGDWDFLFLRWGKGRACKTYKMDKCYTNFSRLYVYSFGYRNTNFSGWWMRFKVASRLFLLLILTWCLGPEFQQHNNEWYINTWKIHIWNLYENVTIPPPLCSELCFQFWVSWNSDLSIKRINAISEHPKSQPNPITCPLFWISNYLLWWFMW